MGCIPCYCKSDVHKTIDMDFMNRTVFLVILTIWAYLKTETYLEPGAKGLIYMEFFFCNHLFMKPGDLPTGVQYLQPGWHGPLLNQLPTPRPTP